MKEEGGIMKDEGGTDLGRVRGVRLKFPRVIGGSRSPEYASVTSLVPLSASTKVERNALPPLVQRRLTTHIATDNIEDIERSTWQGKTIYQVAFKDQSGKHTELQIDERGNIVYDPRGK